MLPKLTATAGGPLSRPKRTWALRQPRPTSRRAGRGTYRQRTPQQMTKTATVRIFCGLQGKRRKMGLFHRYFVEDRKDFERLRSSGERQQTERSEHDGVIADGTVRMAEPITAAVRVVVAPEPDSRPATRRDTPVQC